MRLAAQRIKAATGGSRDNLLPACQNAGGTKETSLPAPENLLIALLVLQGFVGGIDTLLNHELLERLPARPEACSEIGLHALREALYGMLFAAIAWYGWHGVWGLAIAALLAVEIGVDAVDEFVENRTRVLPQNERMLHFLMIMNLGLIAFALALVLGDWLSRPSAMQPVSHGTGSWLLSLFSLAALFWAVRDAIAWRRLARLRPA
jgi:hypothetical protein